MFELINFLCFAQSVDIYMMRLIVEEDPSCAFDSLVISSAHEDGHNQHEERLCGTVMSENFHFPRGPIRVEFTTDATNPKRGFKFQYTLNTIGN